jgi:hypothetical protein
VQDTYGFWKAADTVTSVLVHVSIIAAAVAAAVKLRILHFLGRRYRSELACSHYTLADGRIIFIAEYTIHNAGERPLAVSRVTLTLHPATRDGVILVHDERTILANRTLVPDAQKRGLFLIEAGERSIFTMRCELPHLPEVAFVVCQLSWPTRRSPAPFIGMYVRSSSALSPHPAA